MLSQEILEKLEECKDAKEIQTLAKANGYELTDAQAEEAYDAINGERELTEAELAQVAGGGEALCKKLPRCPDNNTY